MKLLKGFFLIGALSVSCLSGCGMEKLSEHRAELKSHLPPGNYASMFLGRGVSYQFNLTSAVIVKGHSVTGWIREDRTDTFKATSGVEGNTVFTKLKVNCDNRTVTFYEQRSFDAELHYGQTAMPAETKELEPFDMLTLVAVTSFCGHVPEKEVAPAPDKAPSDPVHNI